MEFIKREKDITDAKLLSPLVWAYIGDSVYELYVRTKLVNKSNAKPHKLHIESETCITGEYRDSTPSTSHGLIKFYRNKEDRDKEIENYFYMIKE